MASFKKYYRALYETFGYPLNESAAVPANVLDEAASRLRIKIPRALRDFYLVAGRERRFTKCHNRFLSPTDWSVERMRLIFMEENQSVMWWGVSVRNPNAEDPAISQGLTDEPIQWAREHRKCSEFLAMMLHLQAASGGFRFCGSTMVNDLSECQIDDTWNYYGQLNGMWTSSRPNQVICLTPFQLPFMDRASISIYAGGKSMADLRAIATSLGVTFD